MERVELETLSFGGAVRFEGVWWRQSEQGKAGRGAVDISPVARDVSPRAQKMSENISTKFYLVKIIYEQVARKCKQKEANPKSTSRNKIQIQINCMNSYSDGLYACDHAQWILWVWMIMCMII